MMHIVIRSSSGDTDIIIGVSVLTLLSSSRVFIENGTGKVGTVCNLIK